MAVWLPLAPTAGRHGGSILIAAINVSVWNPTARSAFLRLRAGVCFLTEHKLRDRTLRTARTWFSKKGWTAFSSPALHTPAGGISAGVGVLVRREVEAKPLPSAVWDSMDLSADARSRIAACSITLGAVTVLAVALYLYDTEGMSARNQSLLATVRTLRQVVGLPLLIGGDFNMPMSALEDISFLHDHLLSLPQPRQFTCTVGGGSEVDYIFVPACLEPAVYNPAVVPVGLPHHHAVTLCIRTSFVPTFRALRRPRPLPGVSVHSPHAWTLAQEEAADALGVNSDVFTHVATLSPAQFLPLVACAAEMYALGQSLIPRDEWAAYTGRSGPARITTRKISPALDVDHKSSNPVRFFSGLLVCIQLRRHPGPFINRLWFHGDHVIVSARLVQLLRGVSLFPQPAPSPLTSPPPPLVASTHQPAPGDHDELLHALRQALSSAARSAVADARTKFAQRMQQDMGEHFKLAHSIVREPAQGVADASPSIVLSEQSDIWSRIWSSTDPPVLWRCPREFLPAPGGPLKYPPHRIKHALACYPAHKSQGVDAWDLRALSAIPGFPLALAQFFQLVVSHGEWPDSFCTNLMALLGKPSGGLRTVAKTPMLYRVWCMVSKSAAQAWEDPLPAWDVCRSGTSALEVGLTRLLRTEVATALGDPVSMCFWDMQKFFDTVSHQVLAQEAAAVAFPQLELALAMQQHGGRRYLTYRGGIGRLICPQRSLLPGCFFAIPLVRVLLRRQMSALARTPGVLMTAYVDDVAQQEIGTPSATPSILCAARTFIRAAHLLRLQLSPKSCVFSSCRKTHRALHRVLYEEGVTNLPAFQSALRIRTTTTRDLGTQHVIHKARRVTILRQRIAASTGRLARIRNLAAVDARARRLIPTNAVPKAFWGVEATGVAPTVIKRFRGAMAAGTASTIPGRCATAALACARIRDPEEEVTVRILSAWAQYLFRAVPLQRLRVAWRNIAARILLDGKPVWNRVNGPLAALIATLTVYGWHATIPERWTAPCGTPVFPLSSALPHLLSSVLPSVRKHIWAAAAQQYLGAGLADGVHPASFSAIAYARKHDAGLAGRLEAVATAALWPPARVNEVFRTDSACPRCGHVSADAFHVFWGCPHNDILPHPCVVATRHLVSEARHGPVCLWIRGLLPLPLGCPSVPPPSRPALTYFGDPPAPWPAGTYCTDGSGGKYGSHPSLRRCGVGIAYIGLEGTEGRHLSFGAATPLWGEQTVPRAELAAVLVVCQHVCVGARTLVVVDSRVTCDGVNGGTRHANADLWAQLDQTLKERRVQLSAVWIKSHLDKGPARIEGYAFPFMHISGNAAADTFADWAARQSQVPAHEADRILGNYALAQSVQRRNAAILQYLQEHLPRPHRAPRSRPARTPTPSLTSAIAASAHAVVQGPHGLSCRSCFQYPGAQDVRQWLSGCCGGPPLSIALAFRGPHSRPMRLAGHSGVAVAGTPLSRTHDLWTFRGFLWCRRCGSISSGSAAGRLGGVCLRVGSASSLGRVGRLLRGVHPYYGNRPWPDERSCPHDLHWGVRWDASES